MPPQPSDDLVIPAEWGAAVRVPPAYVCVDPFKVSLKGDFSGWHLVVFSPFQKLPWGGILGFCTTTTKAIG